MAPPFTQLLRPKTLKLSLVHLILSQSASYLPANTIAFLKIHPWSYYVFPHPLLTSWSSLLSHCCFHSWPSGDTTHTYSVKRNSQLDHSPAWTPLTASQHMEHGSQGLPHNLQRPCVIWPLAAHLRTTLSRAPATLPFSLFFSIPNLLQPEALCTHSFLSLDVHAAVLSLQSGLRELFQITLSRTVLLQFLPLFVYLLCFRFLHSFNHYLILYHIC